MSESEKVYQASPSLCVQVAREHLWNAQQALGKGEPDVDLALDELRSLRSWLHPGLEREWDDRMAAWIEREGVPRE